MHSDGWRPLRQSLALFIASILQRIERAYGHSLGVTVCVIRAQFTFAGFVAGFQIYISLEVKPRSAAAGYMISYRMSFLDSFV